MATITIDIKNVDKVLSDFKNLDEKIAKGLKDVINESALKIQSDAKRNAPVNLGNLRGTIYLKEFANNDGFVYSVGSSATYAPYIEFGTPGTQSKANLKIPSGYEEFASQFKGKSQGKFKDMLMALTEWVSKKGITGTYSVKTQRRTGSKSTQNKQNLSAAYVIAISILRKGLRAQPFLIPAFETEKPKLISKIENVIKNAKS